MNMSALRLTLLSAVIALVAAALTLLGLFNAAVPIACAAPLSQTPDATLRIFNNSGQTICYVFISSVTAETWGDDWLVGDETIPPGAITSFDLAPGDYNVFLADCEGILLLDESGVTISELYELRFTGADPCEASLQEGVVFQQQARYHDALQKFQDALNCYRETDDHQNKGVTLNNIGGVYQHLGQYEQALAYYEKALTIRREIDDRPGEGVTLNNIGVAYHSLGQYEQALAHLEEALTIVQEIGDRAGEGVTLTNIGGVYHSLGQYEQALAYYEKALTIRREIDDRAGEGDTLNSIGGVYHSLGQYEQALAYYEKALTIQREIDDRAGEGVTLSNIGVAYTSSGQYEQALAHLEEALTIVQEIGDRAGEGVTLNNIGGFYHSLGQYEQALAYYEKALTIRREIDDRPGEGVTLNNIGVAYHSLGQYGQALDYLERAIAVVETVRGEMAVEEFKSGFTSENTFPYQGIIHLLIEMNRPADAFHYVQRAKARTFLDQLGNVRIAPRATDNPDLLAREQELLGQIRALEAVLAGRSAIASLDTTTRDSPPPLTDEQRTEIQSRLQATYREYEQLLIQIKLTNPQYASLRTVQASTLITVQQTLPRDVTLLEYYVTADEIYAFVVTQEGFHAEAISVTRKSLYQAIVGFHLETRATLDTIPTTLQRLQDALIAPVADRLDTGRLIVALHDVLHYVPFAALYDGEEYLIERHTLVQIPSASVLPFVLGEGEESSAPPLILGDPDGSLPFGRREAEAVAELYKTTAHIGGDALEKLVWEQGPEAGILHLATHGIYNPHAPLFSRVLLTTTTGSEHDGVLEVHEVYNLDLGNADLVVLSACQTNLGERSAGDDIVGLNRAFIYAGTPSVLASLWSVDDVATGDLMVALYRYLREGQPKGEALRRAQMDLLENPDTAHPYYWAGFILTGDDGESKTAQLLANPFYRILLKLYNPTTRSTVWISLALIFGSSLFVVLARGPLEPVKIERPTRPYITLVRKPYFPTWTRRLAWAGCAVAIVLAIVCLLAHRLR